MAAVDTEDIRELLLGAWELVTWQSIAEDGTVGYPIGEDVVGQLMYDGTSERVSAQLVAADQEPFASNDWQDATADEKCVAWPKYFGYFGTFSIDRHAAIVTHHVESG